MSNLSPDNQARVNELQDERKLIEKEEAATTDPDELERLLGRLRSIKDELDQLLPPATA
jgi:hypothetical protein